MKIKREEVTISSVDAINIYLFIKTATIRKAVRFFASKITAETKNTINLFLEITHFRMSSTLIFFDSEYYGYQSREIK